MSKQARGTVFTRKVDGYLPFELMIFVGADGALDDVNVRLPHAASDLETFIFRRALQWVRNALYRAEATMETAAEVLEEVPVSSMTRIERDILSGVSAWQVERAKAVIAQAGRP